MRHRQKNQLNESYTTSDLPRHPATPPQTRYERRKLRREARRQEHTRAKQLLGSTALALGIGFSVAANALVDDINQGIQEGKRSVQGSHAEIHQIYDHDDNDRIFGRHGTFVLTGLGTKNPSDTAELLSAHRDVGDVFALEYSNKDLDTQDMAERVIAQAKKSGLEELSFDCYSAGGPIALDIAAYIHQNESELHIASVTLNSSPIGKDSLTDRSEQGVALMNKILSTYPDFKYYEDGRIMVEVINRSDRYLSRERQDGNKVPALLAKNRLRIGSTIYTIDYAKLREEFDDVKQKMQEPDVASTSLIKSQADFITMTDYDRNIAILSKPGAHAANTTLPLIIYTRSEKPRDDTVVDIAASERNIVESFEEHAASYLVIHKNVGHANPGERKQEYQDMIRRQINPRIIGNLVLGMVKREVSSEPAGTSLDGQALQSAPR